jgi:hypothetical protein
VRGPSLSAVAMPFFGVVNVIVALPVWPYSASVTLTVHVPVDVVLDVNFAMYAPLTLGTPVNESTDPHELGLTDAESVSFVTGAPLCRTDAVSIEVCPVSAGMLDGSATT